MKINKIFATLTIIFFGLGIVCLFGVACGKPTPHLIDFYFSAAKVCAVCSITARIIGKFARKEKLW